MKTSCVHHILVAAILFTTTSAFAFARKLPTTSSPAPTPSPAPVASKYVPLWEKNHPERKSWSSTVRDVVENKAPYLFRGPADVDQFCPMYSRLGTQDKLNFWVEFFAGVSLYESGFKPTSRMVETTMGTDPITGRQVASEGLLQLSYQDVEWAPYCEFDFQKDRQYAINDVRRSILDPATNLSCGIQILDRQVKSHGDIALSKNVYWATLKINGKYTKLAEIKSITRSLSFCKQ